MMVEVVLVIVYEFNDLLENDDRYKLIILNFFEISGNEQNVSISRLEELLGISKYKIVNYITILNKEFLNASMKDRIEIIDNKESYSIRITKKDIHILRLSYLERAGAFLIYKEALSKTQSIEEFADKHFMSLSAAYSRNKQLRSFLEPLGIKIKNGRLKGAEETIRRVTFDLFYQFYNGIKDLFDKKSVEIKKIFNKICESLHVYLSPTQEIKVFIFIGIQYLRVKNKSFLSDNSHVKLKISVNNFDWVERYFKKKYPSLKEIYLSNELIFLKRYLTLQNILEYEESLWYASDSKDALQMTERFIKGLKRRLKEILLVSVEKQTEYFEKLEKEIMVINTCLIAGYSNTDTFSSKAQMKFFEETYPIYHNYINKYFEEEPYLENDKQISINKVTMYYDYLFAINACIPSEVIDNAIYVCVDFSRGKNYSKYIGNSIDSFKDLNIIVEEKISSRTNLYMSDFVVSKIQHDQLIWRNPPTNKDWEHFGDMIVKLKNKGEQK